MIININTSKEKIYEAYLSSLNPALPKQLTPLEIRVLGAMMYIRSIYYYIQEPAKISKLLFHKETKSRIRRMLNVTEPVFNNTLKALRNKKMITLTELKVKVLPIEALSITYNINIKDNG